MKKRILSAIIAASLMVSSFGAMGYAAETDKKVEISFKVGESALSINGVATQVETPYIVGDGVTLVPLRVITEAFGAEVAWEGETKTITLSYPNVNIILQIGNKTAEVNGVAQTLLSAPELTAGGVTMVPLRFISETFGATVGYDDKTGAVLVTKSEPDETESGLIGVVDTKYIGDDFYGWSMENPKDFYMTERRFDGITTQFAYDKDNFFTIQISPNDEDFDFNNTFTKTKDSLAKFTLVKADKDVSDPKCRTVHFQAKDKQNFIDLKVFVTEKYTYIVTCLVAVDNIELKNKMIAVTDTFKVTYSNEDTYNLSNVKEGYRTFKEEELNFSMDIPQDYYQSDTVSSGNIFVFGRFELNDRLSSIQTTVFSKETGMTAETIANHDRASVMNLSNGELVKFGQVEQKTYHSFQAYQYEYTVSGSYKNDSYTVDAFFEKGDYIYNIAITLPADRDNKQGLCEKIFNSVAAHEIDSEKVGSLLRNIDEGTEKYESKGTGWSLTLPSRYKEQDAQADSALYYNAYTNTIMAVTKLSASGASTREVNNFVEEQIKKNSDRIVESLRTVTLGRKSYATACGYYKDEEYGKAYYSKLYATIQNGTIYVFSIAIDELNYSSGNVQEIEEIVASLVI